MKSAKQSSVTNISQVTVSTDSNSSGLIPAPDTFSPLVTNNDTLFEVSQGLATLQQTPGNTDGLHIVQSYLKTLGYNLQVNGVFDEKTRLTVERFQRSKGLPITGHVEKTTLQKIDQSVQDLQDGAEKADRFLREFHIEKTVSAKMKIFNNLEHGPLNNVKAIVLHRTDSPTAQSTLNGYATQNFGAHYLIDTDGTIYQTASLDKKTWHVGYIKSNCLAQSTCSTAELHRLQPFSQLSDRAKMIAIHDFEKGKNYPARYPMNEDSIGIEVVGQYDLQKKSYLPPTPMQLLSIEKLVETIKEHFHLHNDDVYPHALIATKDERRTEGYFLGY